MTRTPRFRKKAHRSNGGPSALGDTPMRVASRCSYTPYRRLLRINDSPRTHVATGAAMVVATATMPMPGVTQSSPSPAVAYATPKNNNTATITFSTTPASPITRPMPIDRGSAYLRRTPPDVHRLQDRPQAAPEMRAITGGPNKNTSQSKAIVFTTPHPPQHHKLVTRPSLARARAYHGSKHQGKPAAGPPGQSRLKRRDL